MNKSAAPMELVDSFKWEKRSKIITRDVHGVSGLMNLTHFSHLSAEPSTPMHFHSGIMEIHCVVKGRGTVRLYQKGRTHTVAYTGGEALAEVVGPGAQLGVGQLFHVLLERKRFFKRRLEALDFF